MFNIRGSIRFIINVRVRNKVCVRCNARVGSRL